MHQKSCTPLSPTDVSTGVHSAEPGDLVTKMVAVDGGSSWNAWLSYCLLKASEPGLFSGQALLDRDSLQQSLVVVVVQDHSQPPLSSTVTLTVALTDSIPDVLADLNSLEVPAYPETSDLTLYLVVSVAAISCIFLTIVIVFLVLRFWRWHTSHLVQAVGIGFAGVPTSRSVGVGGVWAFLQTYSQEASLMADSWESHVIFPQPKYDNILISQERCQKNDPSCVSDDSRFPVGNTSLLQ